MVRSIVGVVGGYAALFAVVFVSFTGAYLLMGTERAFQPGSYAVSGLWLVTSVVLGIAGALVGGLVVSLIARRGSRAPVVLAVLMLVLGAAMAAPAFMGGMPTEVRGPEVSGMEAMQKARTPALAAVLNPFIGAGGVLVGARLRPGQRRPVAA